MSEDVIPFLEASLEHFCRRPVPLAGAAPSCAVPTYALASSSRWSVHLGCWCCCSHLDGCFAVVGHLLRSGYLAACGYLTDALSSLLPGWMLCRHGCYRPTDALPHCARGFCRVLFRWMLCHRGFTSLVGSLRVVIFSCRSS